MKIKLMAGLYTFLIFLSPLSVSAGHTGLPITQMAEPERSMIDTSMLEAPNLGTVIGILVFIAVLIIFIWWILKRRKKK